MTEKTRIEPLPPKRANPLIRAMYRYAKRRFGEVPEPFAVTAHHSRLLLANAIHEAMLQSASRTLPANVRELAVFWTARTVGCSWCVDFGSMLQRLDGLDIEVEHGDVTGLPPAYIASAGFDPVRDDGEAYAEKLRAGGIRVALTRQADLPHGYLSFIGLGGRLTEAMSEAVGALKLGLALATAATNILTEIDGSAQKVEYASR